MEKPSADGLCAALTESIIGAAIEVHRELGPGLLESAYESCLAHELAHLGIAFARQVEAPVLYKGLRIDAGFRMDLIVEGQVILELKAIEKIAPIHKAQVMTYLKLTGLRVGLLINFNSRVLKDGIERIVL